MKRHLLLKVFCVALLIYENEPTANPQFYAPYKSIIFPHYQPVTAQYYHSAMSSWHQDQKILPSPHYQQYSTAFLPSKQSYFLGATIAMPDNLLSTYYVNHYPREKHLEEIKEMSSLENYEEETSPFARSWFTGWPVCPRPNIILPCTCFRTNNQWNLQAGNIVCPALTVTIAQSIFSRIPPGKNIRTVTLSLPRGSNAANSLPESFTANYPQATINIVSPNDGSCLDSFLLSPCTCGGGSITCPVGTSIAQIQAAFNNIAPNTNLGNVVINLPAEVKNIPANFFGVNAANSITLAGAAAGPLSQLTIDSNAFVASAVTCTVITIQQFDIGNLDYSFVTGFKTMSTINLNNCINYPTATNVPKNLPRNPKLISVLVNGISYQRQCPSSTSLAPCGCDGSGTIAVTTCPAGTTVKQMQTVFNNLPTNSNIGSVVLYFPVGATTSIPALILGENSATKIEVIGPASSTLSILSIDPGSFASSAATALQFSITNFDVTNIDYSFLKSFNFLTFVNLKSCTNVPTKPNPPKNLPITLPILSAGQSFLVNGVPYQRVCPSVALLAPCTCDSSGAQAKITCSVGTTLDQIQNVFNNLPSNTNLADLVLNLAPGTTASIPKSFLGSNPAYTINLVGPAGPSIILTIDAASFSESASSLFQFTVTSLDVANVDYSFLSNFKVLAKINFNKCTNSPTALSQLKNFPKNLPSFEAIFVDGKPLTI